MWIGGQKTNCLVYISQRPPTLQLYCYNLSLDEDFLKALTDIQKIDGQKRERGRKRKIKKIDEQQQQQQQKKPLNSSSSGGGSVSSSSSSGSNISNSKQQQEELRGDGRSSWWKEEREREKEKEPILSTQAIITPLNGQKFLLSLNFRVFPI